MKVGDIVEFRCPDVFMEEKFKIRGVGLIVESRPKFWEHTSDFSHRVQWASGEESWEHDTYLELL